MLALGLLFAAPSWAQIEQRCVLMVDRFQDPAELPQFHPVFDQALTVDNLLSFDIDTSTPVSQAGLEFRLLKGPPGMTIDPATGVVTWAPNELQVGTISATVLVTDTDQRRNRHTFCVSVIDPNAAPLIAALADRTVLADEPVSFIVDASDPDPGDQLSFSLDAAPAGMSIQAGSGLVEWLPQAGDIGSAAVTVRATDDGGRFDTESLTITVVAGNAPPVLASIDDRGARPGVALQVQPVASDPDDPVLAWRLLAAPAGMTIDAVSGRIDWTPALPQLGAHAVSVEVADPLGFADTADFEVLVDLNRAPIAVDDSGFRVERGDTLEVAAPGLLGNDDDPNSDPLSALLVDSPLRGTLTLSADGGFDYTPDVPVGTIGLVETLSYERGNGSSTWTPLIGNLDDDPQSELIIADGSGCCTGFLIAIDGITGLEEWVVTLPGRQLDRTSKPALADIDLDGRPEILVIGGEADASPTSALRIYAFEHDGQLKWISEDLPGIFYLDGAWRSNRELTSAAITVADIDQDGLPEILVAPDFGPAGYHVFDHEGLTLEVVHEPGTTVADAAPTRVTVVDLDLDGDPEIVVGNVAWSHDGEMLWKRVDNFGHAWATTFPLVANLDDDPYPELVRTRGGPSSPGNIVAWNHDGTDLMTSAGVPWEVARPYGFNTAPISIADVDADGYADVLHPLPHDVNEFEVLDGRDGAVKWSKSVTTVSMGATVFDMDRDGFVEVLFIDESSNLYVWDGRDGTEKLQLPMNNPRPGDHTIPVFADIDADGASELVVPGGFSFGFDTALSIWESPTDDWAPMRSIWNEHRYHVTNVNDDLTIPAQEPPHWLLPGLNQAMINQRLPEDRIESTDAFTYRANDGELDSNVAEVTIEVLPPNSPPRILSTPPRLASPGFEYVYPVLAVDADPGELLQFAIAAGPPAMSVDGNGRVTWIPGTGDIGPHPVVISVTDTLGTPAYQNFVIDVVEPVTVPVLTGLSEAAALAALESVSLRADPLRDVFSDTVAIGEVAAQSPPAGTSTAAGAGVTVEVSRGPVPVSVPRLVGLDIGDAQARLFDAGLDAFPLEWVNDPRVPRGVVKQQDPPPNARVSPGSDVAIVVSGGPRAVIDVDPPLIVSGGSAGVSVEVRDVDGTPLDPQPAVTLSLDFESDELLGTPPSLSGSSVETSADSRGAFVVQAAFDLGQPETVSAAAAVLPPVSDGPGGGVYSDFTRQQAAFAQLMTALIEAVEAADQGAVVSLDAQLGALESAIDLRRLRTMTAIAPEGGMPPTPAQAISGGLAPSIHDNAYAAASLELVEQLQVIDEVMRAGNVPDAVLEELNQELLAAAGARAALSPSVVGVLRASPSITALLGTFAPRVLVADIRAVRQSLRDEGWIGAGAASRFTLPSLMSAVRIRTDIMKDTYLPYLGEVAWAMGTVIAADLLQEYANAGAIAGIISGASQSFHAFHIPNSVIEGFGFDPTLSPNNAVTMIGPSLFDAAAGAASGLSSAGSIKDVNTAIDAIQTQLDNASALEAAWDDANSIPMGVTSGCILVTTPGCRQLNYPEGFASVYDAEGLLNLPASILIIVRNLESGGTAVFVATFVAYEGEED
ncbi:putative Ig domain-containing protein [Wenzhouxiangella sediminis]|nr:putative Ig domain-containing protein [Wenzhouxiangella sediminis]